MRFGLLINLFLGCLVALQACTTTKEDHSLSFSSPSAGQTYHLGDTVRLALEASNSSFKVKYFVDGVPVGRTLDFFKTDSLPLGFRTLMAVADFGTRKDTVLTNIVLASNVQPKVFKAKLLAIFPHDTSAYTEGLSFVDGKLLESTGEKGASKLRYVDLKTGKTLQQTTLSPQFFGEGSLKVGNKIIMLTWQEGQGFVFDAHTLKQLGSFPYQQSREGWGLTFDGKNILRSDGTNKIWQMDANDYRELGFIEVFSGEKPLAQLNELEYVNGKLLANVYQTDSIALINPKNGVVEAFIDLSHLSLTHTFKTDFDLQNNVLNGIAWDKKGERLFVTGKKWPKLYQVYY